MRIFQCQTGFKVFNMTMIYMLCGWTSTLQPSTMARWNIQQFSTGSTRKETSSSIVTTVLGNQLSPIFLCLISSSLIRIVGWRPTSVDSGESYLNLPGGLGVIIDKEKEAWCLQLQLSFLAIVVLLWRGGCLDQQLSGSQQVEMVTPAKRNMENETGPTDFFSKSSFSGSIRKDSWELNFRLNSTWGLWESSEACKGRVFPGSAWSARPLNLYFHKGGLVLPS